MLIIWAVILSLLLVGEAWPQAGRRHLTEDAHHTRDHAGRHAEDAADEVRAEDLASDCNGPLEGDSGGVDCGSYTSSLPWTSITGRPTIPDITVGTNPADLASRNYAWEVSPRSVNSGVSPSVRVGRNTHSSNRRAGFLELESRDGTDNRLWFNNDGKLCKSDSGDPDGSDSNCEAVGVDPQIITMVLSNGDNIASLTSGYFPIFSGVHIPFEDTAPALWHLGSTNDDIGVPFPAGEINTFGIAVATRLATTTCTVAATVFDDGSSTMLTGSVSNPNSSGANSSSSSSSASVDQGSLMSVYVQYTNCSGIEALGILISMNFVPA